MERTEIRRRKAVRGNPRPRQLWRGTARGIHITLAGLRLLGALAVAGPCLAQDQNRNGVINFKLTVRPQTMATGTQNPAVGEYPMMDSVRTWLTQDAMVGLDTSLKLPNAIVSVPPQCVGAHRCPLVVQLPGVGQSAKHMTDWLRPVANKYGFLLLAVTEYRPPAPRASDPPAQRFAPFAAPPIQLDTALKETLRRFAVDPARIAVIGRCGSGDAAMWFGGQNPEVFSRIASISGGLGLDGMDTTNKTTEYFLDRALSEIGMGRELSFFETVERLRSLGHSVKVVASLRKHEDQIEDYDFLGRWLTESWAKPDPATRTLPVVIDPLPQLTNDAIEKMAAFWTAYMREPDSLWETDTRLPNMREVAIPLGNQPVGVFLTDMAAMAAKYPAIAADLKKAGLTPQQHDAYRAALLGVLMGREVARTRGVTIDPQSTLAKNLAFAAENFDQIEGLENTGVTDVIPSGQVWRDTPDVVKSFGPMGIWRTP